MEWIPVAFAAVALTGLFVLVWALKHDYDKDAPPEARPRPKANG